MSFKADVMAFRSQQAEKRKLKTANKILKDISQLKDDKKVTDTREKVGIFQQDKTKVWTALLKISYTCFITSPEDTCQGLHSCSTDSKRYLQGDVPHLPLVQIQIK